MKYKLVEYDPLFSREYHNTIRGVYDSHTAALEVMLVEQKVHSGFYYRIEEVEESIMNRVKSYEDACKIKGERPFRGEWKIHKEYTTVVEHPDTGQFKEVHDLVEENLPPHIIAIRQLETITAVLNEGWKPDWKDVTQNKWAVRYDTVEQGLYLECFATLSAISPRLYFKSRELAEYAAKQFKGLYEQILIEKF